MDRMRGTFGRQALPMVWDYAETNPLPGASGDLLGSRRKISLLRSARGVELTDAWSSSAIGRDVIAY